MYLQDATCYSQLCCRQSREILHTTFLSCLANCNGKATLRMYQKRFLIDECRTTDFLCGYTAKFVICFLFPSRGMKRIDREIYTVQAWQKASWTLWNDKPVSSTIAFAHRVGVGQQTVSRVLSEEWLHTMHFQRVQALKQADYPLRVEFSPWALQLNFPAPVLFPVEVMFTHEGVFNANNWNMWSNDNTHATCWQYLSGMIDSLWMFGRVVWTIS